MDNIIATWYNRNKKYVILNDIFINHIFNVDTGTHSNNLGQQFMAISN